MSFLLLTCSFLLGLCLVLYVFAIKSKKRMNYKKPIRKNIYSPQCKTCFSQLPRWPQGCQGPFGIPAPLWRGRGSLPPCVGHLTLVDFWANALRTFQVDHMSHNFFALFLFSSSAFTVFNFSRSRRKWTQPGWVVYLWRHFLSVTFKSYFAFLVTMLSGR